MLTPANAETLQLEKRVKAASAKLKAFPRTGPFNLPANPKAPEYRAAKMEYDRAFSALREHNARRCA